MKHWLLILLFFTNSSSYAINIDSLLSIPNQSGDISSYFRNSIKQYKSLINDKSQESFSNFADELLVKMDSINDARVWVNGLFVLGHGFKEFNDFKQAESLLIRAIDYCNEPKEYFKIYYTLARNYQRLGFPKKGLQYVNKIFALAKEDKTILDFPNLFTLKGLCHNDIGEIANALKNLKKSKEVASKNMDKFEESYYEANFYLNRAYADLKSYEKSLELMQETLQYYKSSKKYVAALFVYFNILTINNESKDYHETIRVGHEMIQFKNKYQASTAFGWTYKCMGDAFFKLNQLDSAFYYANLGIEFTRNSNENKELADNLSTMCAILIQQNRFQEAAPLIDKAISLRDYDDSDLLNQYATIQENLGNYKSAYQALRKNWNILEETRSNGEAEKVASTLLEEQFKIEREQKERELSFHRQQSFLYALLAGTFLLFALLFFWLFRQKNRLNRAISQKADELARVNENLNFFSRSISHDMLSIVNMNLNWLSLINSGKHLDEENLIVQKKIPNAMEKSLDRLKTFVNDVLFLSKMEVSKIELESVDLNEIMDLVYQHLNKKLEEKNAQLVIEELPILPQANKTYMYQLFYNLISNSLKYSDHSRIPLIKVTSKENLEYYDFFVDDNGIGIAENQKENIFKPFYQIESGYKGSGLGLTICRKIAEFFRGNINIKNKSREGVVVHFQIPKI